MKKNPHPVTAAPRHTLLLATTSAAVLSYEILLMRLLSIGQWYHFAYMVISMALLGFGAAGSLLFLFFRRIRTRLETWLVALAGATAVSIPLSFSLSQKVGLDPLLMVWQPAQWLNMLSSTLLMAVPFLFGGGIVGIILSGAEEKTHRMYAVDLMGAGCGTLAIVPALYLGPPWILLPVLGGLILLGATGCVLRMPHPVWGGLTLLISSVLLLFVYLTWPPLPKIHETKPLSMTLALPDARIEAQRVGPLGMIDVVGSSLVRYVPGLSLNFGLDAESKGATLPEQKAIFTDGDGLSPITRFRGDLHELTHLDFTTMALPYHIRMPENVLVVGAGGGSDILLGLRHRTKQITALEANHQIADLLLGPFASFSGNIYTRPQVRLIKGEARQFLHAHGERFDQIQLSLIDSFGASTGGLYSASESYLYTTEAFKLYLSHLTESGLLAITRWIKLPPRDSLRVVATALTALRKMRLSDEPERHLLFIRSWKTATVLVSRTPFTRDELLRATAFCDKRGFDLAYYAGMRKEQANRYDIQSVPYYFNGATALCGPEAESFLQDYLFDVSATSDDRPYFSHFFRWKKGFTLLQHLKREAIPMIELGYIFILVSLFQAIPAAGFFILVPLFFLGKVDGKGEETMVRPRSREVISSLIYFGSIGLAFMFMEMAFLPRFTLLLSHPVYSAAIVLGTVLLSAGAGSLFIQRLQPMKPGLLWIPLLAITLWVGFHSLIGEPLFEWGLRRPLMERIPLAILLLSMISFFLGWPFPTGLRAIGKRVPTFIPWAWGVNGSASVVGAILGKCLAVSMGFQMLMWVACGLYLLAIAIFYFGFGADEK